MTETEPDFLDYTEQAQALVSELQRLSSIRAALDDAAATLRSGQTEILSATATLSEHGALALVTYDDAQKHGEIALAAAQTRMNAAADLAESVSGVLTNLQQLQDAAKTLSNSREILAGAATMLAAKGHAFDAGAVAISSSTREIEGTRKALHATHLELHDARSDLARAANNVDAATTALAEQAAHALHGVEVLTRCEAALASSTTELSAARATLERSQVQFEIEGATLDTASVMLRERTTELEEVSQVLAGSRQQLLDATETLDKARQSLAEITATTQDQTRLIRTTMERMVEDQARIGMMVTALEHKQEQGRSAIHALTAENQRHSRETTTVLDQVQRRLLALQPVIESVTAASEEQSRQIALQKQQLAQIRAVILWSGLSLVASIVVIAALSMLQLI